MDKTNKNPNVPNLRFKEFHNEYTILSLGQCLKIKSGKSQKNIECNNGKYKIYGTGGIIGFTNEYLYDKESVGIGRKGTINKPFYFNEPFWTVDTLFYSEIKENNVSKYIYYLFQTIPWKKYNTSTGVPSLTSSSIEAIEKGFPLKEEQYKIATFLSFIDKRIQTQIKIIDDYSLLKNSISSSLFINMDVKTKLSDICIINKGQQINGSDLHENGLYYMMNGGISPSGYLNMYNKNENTISISEGGNSCGYVQFNTTKFWSGGHCYTIENLNPIINNKFLYYYLKFSESKIMNLRIGTGLPNIQKRDLEHFKVPIPNIEIQSFIINVLDCINSKINAEKQLLNLYQFQKSYLLKNMFV